MNALENAKQMT